MSSGEIIALKRELWKQFGMEKVSFLEQLVNVLRTVKEFPYEERNRYSYRALINKVAAENGTDREGAEFYLEKLNELGWIRMYDEGDIRTVIVTEKGEKVLELTDPSDILSSRNVLEAIDRLLGDFIAGEEANRKILLMTCFSAYLRNPMSAIVIGESGTGKSHLIKTVSMIFPDEDVLRYTRMSAHAPEYEFAELETLDNKIIVVEQLFGMEEAQRPFLILLSEGYLHTSVVDPKKKRTLNLRVEGKPVLLTTSTRTPGIELGTRVWILSTSSSREQTEKILNFKKRVRKDGLDLLRIIKLRKAVRAITEEIRDEGVIIPYIDFIEFPLTSRARRDFDKFIDLIAVSAAVNHINRPVIGNTVLATLEDYGTAVSLMKEVMPQLLHNLPKTAFVVYEALREVHENMGEIYENGVPVSEIRRRLNEKGYPLTERTVRHYLKLLCDEGLAEVYKEGRKNYYTPVDVDADSAIPGAAELAERIDIDKLRKTISEACGMEPGEEVIDGILLRKREERVAKVKVKKLRVKILKDVHAFLGMDLNLYGPYKPGDIVELPEKYAMLLIERKKAEKIDK